MSRSAARSTRSSEPSTLPRSRRSGQSPSWTPATTTTSHSRPLAACAVSTRTTSPCSAAGARLSAAMCWPWMWSRKISGPAPGSRSTNRAADSKNATTASRSRSAEAPRIPPSALACCHCSARPEVVQTAQSTFSTVELGSAATSLATAISRAIRTAGWAQRSSSPARPGCPSRSPRPASSRGSPSASASSAPEPRGSPAAAASRRSSCRSRRNASVSAPPSGEVSSAIAASSSSAAGRSAHSSTSSSGATPGCSASGSSSPATPTGTPACTIARRNVLSCCAVERTTTAIADHGTPSSRCASRSRCATYAASWLGEPSTCTSTSPGTAPGTAVSSRCRCGPRSRIATRREAPSSSGPQRRLTVSATVGAGSRVTVGNRSGKRRMHSTSEPRNA